MKKILSLLLFASFAVFANAQIEIKGGITSATTEDYPQNALRFTFKNTSGKTIANCDFKLVLPECAELIPKGKKYQCEEGDATEGMTFSVQANSAKTKYSVAVYDGEFDETAGDCIIYVPVKLKEGFEKFEGVVKVSDINFGDPDGNNIFSPADFNIDIATAIKSISAEQTKSGVIYNVAGQRVSKATKGIYVVDGKKVAVK